MWCACVTPPGAQNEWATVSGRQKTGEAIECNIKRHVAGIKQMICFGIKLGSAFENALQVLHRLPIARHGASVALCQHSVHVLFG